MMSVTIVKILRCTYLSRNYNSPEALHSTVESSTCTTTLHQIANKDCSFQHVVKLRIKRQQN
uniref:Uncharacterized protein n=1 Tax=Kalanchoe fedtschenkoi TaxID=63787 RepID=A0A7N0U9W9_KALFE